MKLSVILPVYNVEKYLRKCLDSLIDDSCSDYELVCVNDGSTDSSGEILKEYEARYPGIVRVIVQENQGLSEARNTAIRNATGDFILLIDSDDYMDPGSMPRLMKMIETGADMMLIEFRVVDEAGNERSQSKTYDTIGPVKFDEHPEILFTLPTGLFRRSLYTDHNILYPRGKLYEDLATMPKLFLHGNNIYYFGDVIYNYVQHSGSIMNSGNAKQNTDIIDALDNITAYYKEQGAFEKYYDELEYINYYNQYITTIVRVSRIRNHGDLPARFREDFLKKFPDYRSNKYVKKQSKKIKLLDRLITAKQFWLVAAVMDLNDWLAWHSKH